MAFFQSWQPSLKPQDLTEPCGGEGFQKIYFAQVLSTRQEIRRPHRPKSNLFVYLSTDPQKACCAVLNSR